MYNCFFDMRDCMLDGSGECVHRNGFAVLSSVDSSLCSLCDTCSLQCRDLNYLAAELTGKLGDVDLISVFLYNVHHVDGNYNRNTELGELGGEVKVTLKVRTVDDIEYSIGALADKYVSRYDLLKGVGRERIYAGKVGDNYTLVLFQLTFLLFDRNARPVTDELV